jgi:hypothetical protein
VTSPDPQHRPGTGRPLLTVARDLTQRLAARAQAATPAPISDSAQGPIWPELATIMETPMGARIRSVRLIDFFHEGC